MKYSIVNLGTLKVNAFEMIMGVPEYLIREHYVVDEHDQMRIGMQGLIVETDNKIIFIDPGCATFLSKSLAETYDLHMELSLEEAVKEAAYKMEDITDVLFTHLHFDHGSGAFFRIIGGIVKAFPNANYVISKKQLDFLGSLSKDKSTSFFHKLLRFAGDLTYFEDWSADGMHFHVSHGHTPHMLVPVINLGAHDLLYATDVIPMELHREKGAWSYYDEDKVLLEKERGEIVSVLRPGSEIIYYHETSKK
jgi:glyoxylase-like metal-dependent hydrolase (beta-lactamase superfamily II)